MLRPPSSTRVQAVPDPSGRETLIEALRCVLLNALACAHCCNKIACGDNATRAAVRVISLATQGTGFALPASLHYLDARFDFCHFVCGPCNYSL